MRKLLFVLVLVITLITGLVTLFWQWEEKSVPVDQVNTSHVTLYTATPVITPSLMPTTAAIIPTPTPKPLEFFQTEAVVILPDDFPCEVHVQLRNEKGNTAKDLWQSVSQTGKFTFENCYKDQSYKLVAHATGLVSTYSPLFTFPTRSQDLYMYDRPVLDICIRTESDSPVAGAKVSLQSNTKGIYVERFIANEEGKVRHFLPHLGTYIVTASHILFPNEGQGTIEVEHNPNTVYVVMEERFCSISGVVLDEWQTPVSGADVLLFRDKLSSNISMIKTNETGNFHFSQIPFGTYYIKADAGERFLAKNVVIANGAETDLLFKTVTVDIQQPDQFVRFQVPSSYKISGRVLDHNHQPLPDAAISTALITGRAGATIPIQTQTLTNQEGMFTLYIRKRIGTLHNAALSIQHPKYGHQIYPLKPIDRSPVQEGIEIVMQKNSMGVVSGIIKEASTNSPVGDAHIFISNYMRGSSANTHFEVFPNENGEFKLELPVGNYNCKNIDRELINPQPFLVKENETLFIELLVEPQNQNTIDIKGKVVDKRTKSPINLKTAVEIDKFLLLCRFYYDYELRSS